MKKYAELRNNDMMRHLLESLEAGKDIGHYGRLVLAVVGCRFMEDQDLVAYLKKNPGFDEPAATALVHQVRSREYNPPRREKILQWQKEQEFPICPAGDDPDGCNLYRGLKFPEDVYHSIEEYHVEKAQAH